MCPSAIPRRLAGGAYMARIRLVSAQAPESEYRLSDGATIATPAQIRDLVERDVIQSQAATVLAVLRPADVAAFEAEVEDLLRRG
jgi:hypothetical protein